MPDRPSGNGNYRRNGGSRIPMKVAAHIVLAILVVINVIRSFTLLPDNHQHVVNVNDDRSITSIRHQMDQSPPESLLASPSNRTMLFVHVGKAGGETIKWRLKVICNLRASKRKKARCLEQFEQTGDESKVSHATIGYMHCDSLRPRMSIQNATTFMVSLRDPIDRIVSWFQYMHPQNCIPERPSGACNLKKDNKTWGMQFFQQCFPKVNDMVRSIHVPLLLVVAESTSTNLNCSAIALETIQGKGPVGPTNHLFFNYQFYANRTTVLYPHKDVVVIRQEMLWDDLRRIERLLGGDPFRPFETEGPVVNHGSDQFRYRAILDPSLIPSLCCLIPNEIRIYKNLLDRAINLETRHKKYSIQSLFSKCKVDSLQTLSTQCGWKSNRLDYDLSG